MQPKSLVVTLLLATSVASAAVCQASKGQVAVNGANENVQANNAQVNAQANNAEEEKKEQGNNAMQNAMQNAMENKKENNAANNNAAENQNQNQNNNKNNNQNENQNQNQNNNQNNNRNNNQNENQNQNQNQNQNNNAAAANEEPDFGDCDPTMSFEVGRPGRKADEGTFLPNDPKIAKGQQDALNQAIITNRICDQVKAQNTCNANEAALQLCLQAKQEADAIKVKDQNVADTFNNIVTGGNAAQANAGQANNNNNNNNNNATAAAVAAGAANAEE